MLVDCSHCGYYILLVSCYFFTQGRSWRHTSWWFRVEWVLSAHAVLYDLLRECCVVMKVIFRFWNLIVLRNEGLSQATRFEFLPIRLVWRHCGFLISLAMSSARRSISLLHHHIVKWKFIQVIMLHRFQDLIILLFLGFKHLSFAWNLIRARWSCSLATVAIPVLLLFGGNWVVVGAAMPHQHIKWSLRIPAFSHTLSILFN